MKKPMNRRTFFKQLGTTLAAGAVGHLSSGCGSEQMPQSQVNQQPTSIPPASGPNLLLIITDQERFPLLDQLPPGFDPAAELPAHTFLQANGVSFTNHHIAAAPCTPSRSVLYTGQHIPRTGMFDNTDFPYIRSMSPELPTIGHMLREAGYYTAYKGKWHLSKSMDPDDTGTTVNALEPHGFADYNPDGDHGHTLEGYAYDDDTARAAVEWLQATAPELDRPWFLALNFINPHDVMYFDSFCDIEERASGTDGEASDAPIDFEMACAPTGPEDPDFPDANTVTNIYRSPDGDPIAWDAPISASFFAELSWNPDDDPASAPNLNAFLMTKPAAHRDFDRICNFIFGDVPKDRLDLWQNRLNYYINCTRDVDRHVSTVLQALETQGLLENTVIIYTADHGEMCGAHAMWHKGPLMYRENLRVPLIIAGAGIATPGQTVDTVSSSVDLVPSLLVAAGVADWQERWTDLVGYDLFALAQNPATPAPREAALFAYDCISTLDADFVRGDTRLIDLRKRGRVRGFFDGRYKFARYFDALTIVSMPSETLDDLLATYDLELYDVANDPDELDNLATVLNDPQHPRYQEIADQVLALNAQLNELIEREVGSRFDWPDGLPLPDAERFPRIRARLFS